MNKQASHTVALASRHSGMIFSARFFHKSFARRAEKNGEPQVLYPADESVAATFSLRLTSP